jgi:hypothetical protein
MPGLIEPLGPARIVGRPARYEPLKGFSCGPGEQRWERHVDGVAGRLARGQALPQTLVVIEDAADALVGVCSFFPRDLLLPVRSAPLRAIPYINMIGVGHHYRGVALADGSHPADALLDGVLEQIARMHGGSAPHVYALVAPQNAQAHALFARHGFGEISPLKQGGEAIRIRPPA